MGARKSEGNFRAWYLTISCAILLSSKALRTAGLLLLRGAMFDYNSVKWKRLAHAIMRRDNYMCQLSKRYGKRAPAEVVHHIYPADEYPEYAYKPWNLIALSWKMHNTLHDRNTDALTAEGVALMRRTRHV